MVGRGLLLVISAPSGAGKTTLCKELAANVPELWQSVSYTTRQPRPGEVDGREYRFVVEAVFRDMVERSAFAEWASVYGHLYGTPKGPLNEKMASGIDVLLEIDGQAAGHLLIERSFATWWSAAPLPSGPRSTNTSTGRRKARSMRRWPAVSTCSWKSTLKAPCRSRNIIPPPPRPTDAANQIHHGYIEEAMIVRRSWSEDSFG